jgi:hypothetical protein
MDTEIIMIDDQKKEFEFELFFEIITKIKQEL